MTTLKNNTGDPILCTLREANTGVQGKVPAGAGAARNRHNLPSASSISIPVAVIGASAGLLDAFISDEGPIKSLLFPNETMSRTTPASFPFDDADDLEMI